MILVDTDHFSVLTDRRHAWHVDLLRRLGGATEPLGVPVVTVEEQFRGWMAQIRRIRDPHGLTSPYDRLVELLEILSEWDIARWTSAAADHFNELRAARIRVGTQDLRIASIALANGALLLSANQRDFAQVPGLRVEDWLR